MSDKYINAVGVQTIRDWANGKFALDSDLDTLSGRVDEIVSEGGEPNVIDTVKVNGTALTPVNKAVDVTVPTQTSALTNNGDGDSPYATEAYVEANGGKIDVIKVNGTAQTITNKEVDIQVPLITTYNTTSNKSVYIYEPTDAEGMSFKETANGIRVGGTENETSIFEKELVDKSYVDTTFRTEAQVQSAIDAALSDITGIDFQVVSALPTTGEHGVIYLLHNQSSPTDIYDEYIWVTPEGGTAHYELIGTTAVDLSGYWAIADLSAMTVSEINAILIA